MISLLLGLQCLEIGGWGWERLTQRLSQSGFSALKIDFCHEETPDGSFKEITHTLFKSQPADTSHTDSTIGKISIINTGEL